MVKYYIVGAWRSLVAHQYGVLGVGGSNPLAPTIKKKREMKMLKKKIINVILTVVILLIMVSAMVSANAATLDGIKYTHSTLNFSVTLPSSWAGKYKINETADSAWFVNIKNEKAGFGGLLFGLEVYNENPYLPTQYTELLRMGGKYFYAVYAGDIEYDYGNASLTKEYNDMYNDIETVLKTFSYTEEFSFIDVSANAWYFDAVNFCYNFNLMNGTEKDRFSPNATLTRGMIVTILYRLNDTPDMSELKNPFSDVPEYTWYTNAVKWASANNIVNGYGDSKFGSNDAVTKEQLAVIIYRMGEESGKMPPAIGRGVSFKDIYDVSDWAYEAVSTLNKLGMFMDIPSSNFSPQTPATRAEVASILYRYVAVVENY